MTAAQHPAASHHLPWFLTAPGDSDILFTITTIIVLLVVFGLGTVFFRLHSLPERLGHKKLQFEIVAVLGLLSLFTHVHLFWVAGLLLALIDLPDFQTPLRRIATSLDKLSGTDNPAEAEPGPTGARAHTCAASSREPRPCWNSRWCSLFTILPDYLFRRYWQGSGSARAHACTRYGSSCGGGITACLMLTVILITIIFYYHPSTTNAAPLFRTVAILPETNGRVSEIYVKWRDKIEKGAPHLQARQHQTRGRPGAGEAPDRRGGRSDGHGAGRHRRRRRQDH